MGGLIDLGPAIAPPSWVLPATEPEWWEGKCYWNRYFAAGNDERYVWVSCSDSLVDGRWMRSQPIIRTNGSRDDELTVAEFAERIAAQSAAFGVLWEPVT